MAPLESWHRQATANERQLRLMLDCVQDYAICLLSPNGEVSDWNRGAERILGYSAEQILGQHFGCFYTQADRAGGAPMRALGQAVETGASEGEGWRIRCDGGRFWGWSFIAPVRDEAGELIGFAHSIRDITERQAAQKALRESERQFRLLVNGVADHAIYMLDPNGVVISWNAGAERIKGYAADEAIGQHFSRFFTEADRREGLPTRALIAAMENGRHHHEGWRIRKDGSLFWAEATLHAVRDDGKLVGFAKITRDRTEQQAAEVELQRTQERLFHAQRVEALGQLTAGVAHDFNNLLTVIEGQSDALLKDAPAASRERRIAELILAATERGKTLTQQLLAFARRQPIKPVAVNPGALVADCRDLLAKSAGPQVEVVLELEPDVWEVLVHPTELELALINLVVNARDAMPGGGAITVAVQNSEMRTETGEDAQASVLITVRDTGPGIPTELRAKVFDPFFTTKSSEGGTGLGLSQVLGFAAQAGGEVGVDDVKAGASITIRLPRSPTDSGGPAPEEDRRLAADGANVVAFRPPK